MRGSFSRYAKGEQGEKPGESVTVMLCVRDKPDYPMGEPRLLPEPEVNIKKGLSPAAVLCAQQAFFAPNFQ